MKSLNSVSITGTGRKLPSGRFAVAFESLKLTESKLNGGGGEMAVLEFKVLKAFDQETRPIGHPAGPRAEVQPGEVDSYIFKFKNGDVAIASLRQAMAAVNNVDWTDEATLEKFDADKAFKEACAANNPKRGTIFFVDVQWKFTGKYDPKDAKRELWFGVHTFYPESAAGRYVTEEKQAA